MNPNLKTNGSCDIGEIVTPLWQQAIDWFREKHSIYIWIYYAMIFESLYYQIRYEINKSEYHHYTNEILSIKMEKFSFEQSRKQAILKAIELCQNKK